MCKSLYEHRQQTGNFSALPFKKPTGPFPVLQSKQHTYLLCILLLLFTCPLPLHPGVGHLENNGDILKIYLQAQTQSNYLYNLQLTHSTFFQSMGPYIPELFEYLSPYTLSFCSVIFRSFQKTLSQYRIEFQCLTTLV